MRRNSVERWAPWNTCRTTGSPSNTSSSILLPDGCSAAPVPWRSRRSRLALLDTWPPTRAGSITKHELLDAIWPGVDVDDGALKVCVREIRRALDDDARAPRYARRRTRRGYRFIAPVRLLPRACGAAPALEPTIAPIRYARSGDVNIAYQVIGSGPIDLVFVMGWVSHLEYYWSRALVRAFPETARRLLTAHPLRQARHWLVGPP